MSDAQIEAHEQPAPEPAPPLRPEWALVWWGLISNLRHAHRHEAAYDLEKAVQAIEFVTQGQVLTEALMRTMGVAGVWVSYVNGKFSVCHADVAPRMWDGRTMVKLDAGEEDRVAAQDP